ncbi:MAG: sigma-54-dependent Fis family transcriptional regulator [Acidimicrobiia bacterium]|nr:sigma-54-dependent Fis family transcriptional regulator [Acidimicrobiia bacterium]
MKPNTILLAEDEPQARDSLRQLLEEEGYRVVCAADGNTASDLLRARPFDAALLDIRMPGKDGLTLLGEISRLASPPAVLIMTAYGTSAAAIEAMKLGAFDYITKPIRFDELHIQLERAINSRLRTRELEAYRATEPQPAPWEMVGSSPAMQQLYKSIGQVAPTDSTVLILGESGTGKDLVATAIHLHSRRAGQRMVKVNCASIPESLLEAELFGHEKGAFTGAAQRRIGKFEYAAGGTIFLDEIGELSGSTQAKLLRVLQERSIERLGSNLTIELDVRVVAATNRDLKKAVQEGSFREDLFYRLHVFTIQAPPLRERREDIRELAPALLSRSASRLQMPVPPITEDALNVLESRDWPGNVRQLEHCLERALILSRGGPVSASHLDAQSSGLLRDTDEMPLDAGFHECVSWLQRRLVTQALADAAGNRTKAAESLKINRRLLYDKMREFGIE